MAPGHPQDYGTKVEMFRATDPSRQNWLKTLLPKDFPTARIMTFSYDADWIVEGTDTTTHESGRQLLRDIVKWKARQQVSELDHLWTVFLIGGQLFHG